MTAVLLLGLVVLWAAVLVPPWLRDMGDTSRRRSSVDQFQRQLSTLSRTGPTTVEPANRFDDNRAPIGSVLEPLGTLANGTNYQSFGDRLLPTTREAAELRRRVVLQLLIAAAIFTLLLSLVTGMILLFALHLVVDGLLAGFVVLLHRHRNIAAERSEKVRYLAAQQRPQRIERAEPTWLRKAR